MGTQPATLNDLGAIELVGTSVQTTASTNTKPTTYTTLISSLNASSSAFLLHINSNEQDRSFLVDIATGAASSEASFVNDLIFSAGAAKQGVVYLINKSVASGARMSARCQSTTASATCFVHINAIQGTWNEPAWSSLTTIGAVTSGHSGGTSHTPGNSNAKAASWTQIIASTAVEYNGLIVAVGDRGQSNQDDAYYLIDISDGGAGSESSNIIIPDLSFGSSGTEFSEPQAFPFIPINIAASSRLSVRASSSDASATAWDVIFYAVQYQPPSTGALMGTIIPNG